MVCGSSLDCPSRKYADSADETVEYGVCVGSTLDNGKTIPKTIPPLYTGNVVPPPDYTGSKEDDTEDFILAGRLRLLEL
ncbi:MAG: hypothetical protein AAB666_01765, partial [Patescibacteria group bacterium]